jgi:hypothetical protein
MRTLLLCILLISIFSPSFADDDSHKRVLIDKDIEVPRGEYKELHFLVPEGKWKFKGRFKTSGGMNDDINLIVLNQENYVRWYSRYTHEPALKLNKKQEGKFEIIAASGQTYYFVFDNFFSTISNKKVKLKIELVPLDND